MKLGVTNHTHAKVHGVDNVRILKLLGEQDGIWEGHDYWTARPNKDGWTGGIERKIIISSVRDPNVIAPGDVVRLRENSSLVSVLWRRGARTNTLFTTERCNSLCLMCSQPPRDEDDRWRVSELLQTIPLIDPDEVQLGITGGEPTLLEHGLTEVLEACKRHLPSTELHILTNGRNFRDQQAAREWVTAGGRNAMWAVPLYADVPDIHDEVVGATNAFDETLDGLFELAHHDARVEIRVVLHKMTVPRLRQLVSFIYRRLPFVDHVALMALEPMGFAKTNREKLWIDPADYLSELRDAVFFLANRGMNVSIYNLSLCVLPRPLWQFARQSISEWKNTFPTTCAECVVRDHCSGFFASAGPDWRSREVAPLTLKDLNHELA